MIRSAYYFAGVGVTRVTDSPDFASAYRAAYSWVRRINWSADAIAPVTVARGVRRNTILVEAGPVTVAIVTKEGA